MANELAVEHLAGKTVYAVVTNAAGQRWNTAGTPAFENHNDANWGDYDVAAAPQGTSGRYQANMPAGIIIAGYYYVTFYEQAAGTPHITNDLKVGTGRIRWTGSAELAPIEHAARHAHPRQPEHARRTHRPLVSPVDADIYGNHIADHPSDKERRDGPDCLHPHDANRLDRSLSLRCQRRQPPDRRRRLLGRA